jgi:prephenate dehydratase
MTTPSTPTADARSGPRVAFPRIAFLGPDGTFSDQAASAVAPDHTRLPLPTIVEVIDAVRDGRCDLGVVPMENSIEGSVTMTLDELAFGGQGVAIRAEIHLPVAMHLMASSGTRLTDVEVVRSHPHGLAQVRQWLLHHMPRVAGEAVASTAEAARQARDHPGVAAVGNLIAAERYGLTVLASQIQDYDGNVTRFAVLGRHLAPPTGVDKTSLVVFMGADHPGQLRRILDEFASRGVNLTKIESRPTKQRLGEYCILIDCAGHLSEARVGEALRGLHRHVAQVRILGSYQRADQLRDDPEDVDSDAAYAGAAQWYAELLDSIAEDPSAGGEATVASGWARPFRASRLR